MESQSRAVEDIAVVEAIVVVEAGEFPADIQNPTPLIEDFLMVGYSEEEAVEAAMNVIEYDNTF